MDLVFKNRKKNRKCIRLQKEKIDLLKVYFQKYPYPKKEQYDLYAKEIDETAAKVENWFKYQRRTYKTTGIIKDFKERKILSKDKERILEDAFRDCIKPHPDRYKQLAKFLDSDVKPIKKWFSYRRRKLNQIQKTKKKSKNFSDFSSNSNSGAPSAKNLNDYLIKKEDHNDFSNENSYLMNYDKKNNKNSTINSNNEIKKDFNRNLKNECYGENSSVFYSSNDGHSNSNGKKAVASNFLNENHSNSNDQNHSDSNDSNNNSNDHLNENRNNSNSNSNRGSGSNQISNSNGESHNSQFKTNSSSNLNYNNSKAGTGVETRDTISKNEIRHKKICKYANSKGQIKKQKCNIMHSQENDDSNNSSKQKYSDDSYNLNYFLNSYNGKAPSQNIKQNNEDYLFQNGIKNETPKFEAYTHQCSNSISDALLKNNNFDKNPSEINFRNQNPNIIMSNNVQPSQNLIEMNPGYIKYTPKMQNMQNIQNEMQNMKNPMQNMQNQNMQNPMHNMQNPMQNLQNIQNIQNMPICIPIQMNQPYNNQIPFNNNYMDPNKNQQTIIYQYGNLNNTNNYPPLRNNNVMYLAQNPQNLNNNYQIVPNYVLSQNPNNSFQIVQVGMSLRPVSNVLMIPQETIQRNNVQFPSYVICPINNNNNMQNQSGDDTTRIKETSFN